MSTPAQYDLPDGPLGLQGPVARVAPGTLPLRGDLAHICLAGKYLAAHYVVPECRTVGARGADMLLAMQDAAEPVLSLDAGAVVEVLDYAGDWCWAACGPRGPSGYFKTALLEER